MESIPWVWYIMIGTTVGLVAAVSVIIWVLVKPGETVTSITSVACEAVTSYVTSTETSSEEEVTPCSTGETCVYQAFTKLRTIAELKTMAAIPNQMGLDINGTAAGDQFGGVVDMSTDGSRMIVGAYKHDSNKGHVRIFDWKGTVWTQVGGDIDGLATGDKNGFSVSISGVGTRIAMGANAKNTSAGQVRAFDYKQSNLAVAVGAGDAMAGAGVLNLTSTTGFDSTGTVSINSEQFTYTGVTPPTLTGCTRAANGTTAADHTVGNTVMTWTLLGAPIDGEASSQLGAKVSLSKDGAVLAASAPFHNSNTGYVSVLTWSGSEWTLRATILGSAGGVEGYRGLSLNNDGTTLLTTSTYVNSNTGRARIFRWNNTSYEQLGTTIAGLTTNEAFGYCDNGISGDGNRVAIGAPSAGEDQSGAVRIYSYSTITGLWTLTVTMARPIDADGYLDFGSGVSISTDGSRVAIGADGGNVFSSSDNAVVLDTGYVSIYEEVDAVWIQVGPDIVGEYADDWSGYPVSLSGDGTRVAIGGPGNDDAGTDAGHVRVYALANYSDLICFDLL